MSDADVADERGIRMTEQPSKGALEAENEKLRRSLKKAKRFSVICLFVVLIAFGAIIAILLNLTSDSSDNPSSGQATTAKNCGSPPNGVTSHRSMIGEPEEPGLFHDVTVEEINNVRQFLKDAGILTVDPEDALLSDAYIYTIDLQPPTKTDALRFLDDNGDAPSRHARVYLFRGDLNHAVVEEHICGPLTNVSSCTLDRETPFAYRPIENREYLAYEEALFPAIHRDLGDILNESFGGSFDFENCEDDCLNWWGSLVSNNVYGETNVRKLWLMPCYDLPYYSVFPVDMAFLCNINGTDPSMFHVEKVWYAGQFFESVESFNESYANDSINKISRTYPTEEEARFATLNPRQQHPKPAQRLRAPELIEPDGKRYTIEYRKVHYLDMWSFHYRNSPIYGPALYDVQFLEERIAYELSLQEMVNIYSGSNPESRLEVFLNSVFLTGSKSKALVPGADCPKTATFLPITVTAQDREEPAVFRRAICIFEQNSGVPLRRHHSYSVDEKTFYGGMLDSSLVVRSIHTIDNTDYVIDFTFHQSGALGVSIHPTGYLAANVWSLHERPYGHQIQDALFGPMNQFVAHFKVDLDVGGSADNRYETLAIKEETVTLRGTTPERNYSQTKFDFNLKNSEMDAAYAFDFDHPVHHIIYNNASRNEYGEKKACRIVNQSPSKKLVRDGLGTEPSFAWARYQMAVTKRKEDEQRSTSSYGQYDSLDPSPNFQSFLDDNENIVDEDLVAWVTIGSHNIPTSEDLPISSTAGKTMSFYILPHNAHTECPSMASRDAVYIDEEDADNPADGLRFDFHGTGNVRHAQDGTCTYKPYDWTSLWNNEPDELFEITYNKGVY